jgi:hypothetical protein
VPVIAVARGRSEEAALAYPLMVDGGRAEGSLVGGAPVAYHRREKPGRAPEAWVAAAVDLAADRPSDRTEPSSSREELLWTH